MAPFTGAILTAGKVRCLPDALHCPGSPARHRAYPGDPIRVMKEVIISAPRY